MPSLIAVILSKKWPDMFPPRVLHGQINNNNQSLSALLQLKKREAGPHQPNPTESHIYKDSGGNRSLKFRKNIASLFLSIDFLFQGWQTMSQFIGLNLQIWKAGGLASFQMSSLVWTVQSMMDEVLAFYRGKKKKKKKKASSRVFEVGCRLVFIRSIRSPVQSSIHWQTPQWVHIHPARLYQLDLSNQRRMAPQSSASRLLTLCSRCTYAFTPPAEGRCLLSLCLFTLVGSYDVRIGWVSSSELKHCGATQHN